MTALQLRLLEEAHGYWEQGRQIPLDLFARLAQQGFDVETLESKHRKET